MTVSIGLNLLLCGVIAFLLYTFRQNKKTFIKRENDTALFLKNTAHDLRSPLTNIKGYAELLTEETLPEEKREESLYLIASEAERLARLAGRLTEGKDAPLHFSVFDLSECLHTITLTLLPKAKKRGISFVEKNFSQEKPYYVNADREAVFEAAYNLCDNAVKYADENTPVTLSLCEKNGRILCDITNGCRTFDPQDSAKLFSVGYRGSSGQNVGGSGLGLSIAKRLLTAHGTECAPTFSYSDGLCRFAFSLKKAEDYRESE